VGIVASQMAVDQVLGNDAGVVCWDTGGRENIKTKLE
jgi:hypothetical protein